MNMQSFVTITKRSALIAAATFLFNAANAQTATDKPVISYTGEYDGQLGFKLLFNNPTGNRFTVKVKDVNNDVIYSMDYRDKSFEKMFLLPNEGEASKYTFVIVTGKNEIAEAFKVKTATKIQADYVVSKL
jgi:hypothetical protein